MNGTTGTVTPGRFPDSCASGPGDGSGARPARDRGIGGGLSTAAAAWPLFSGLGPLGALSTVPRLARAFTAMVLDGWSLGEAAEVSQLIVSELATNVVRAATGPGGSPVYDSRGRLSVLWLRLMTDESLLGIEVWDNLPAASGVPLPREAGPDAESGRGLEIVAAVSLDWGWEPVPGREAAKRTWAVLAVRR